MPTFLSSPAAWNRAVLALAASGAAGLAIVAAQPPGQQRPTFRAAANFVQVDVYPTASGRPVGDLSKDDFEVLEDGVPQAVATFEHISVPPAPLGAQRVEPRSVAESNDLASDPHNRLFVLFLDTYHVTDPTSWHDATLRMPGSTVRREPAEKKPLGPRGIDKALVSFLERAVGPTDLVAAMSPEMDVGQMVFTRRPERFEQWLSTVWGRRFSWDDLDPEEERWAVCYPPDDVGDPFGCYKGIFEEMVLRRRERLTLEALRSTVDRLGDLREGRKALLLVSEGWQMYRPNQRLARAVPKVSMMGCPPEAPTAPGIYVGPGGRLQSGTDPRTMTGVDRHGCDAIRLQLALADDEADYRKLIDRANRETVSVYPVDPRGLAVFDTPMDARSPGRVGAPGAAPGVIGEFDRLRGRLETLRNLASATDGTMTETNDLAGGLKKIADDLSEYYLLGYNSTNAKPDGRLVGRR